MGKSGDQVDPNTYLNLARLQGYVSNPNVISPYGTSYTQWGKFDEAGYKAAQSKYEQDIAAYNASAPPAGTRARAQFDAIHNPPVKPTTDDFTINKDQATIIQALTPLGEATKNFQQQGQYEFGKAGKSAAEQAAAAMANPFKYTGPGIQTSLDTSKLAAMPVNAGTTAQQAIMSRLAPQLQAQREQLRTSLVNQGLAPGGEAYNAAMTEQSQNENDLLTQAALQGINLDMSARNQGLTEEQTKGQFGNQAINQSLNQQLGLYNQPLATATNLMQASAFQNPNFSTGFQSPNYGQVGTQMQNDVNAANAQRNQNIGGMMQAGTTIAAAALSDRRLKTNIVKVGDDPRGFGIYEYDIFGRRERGVMAQEVEKIIPDAVMEHPSGYKMVNYGAL
jgi:hypothetical protein